MQVDLEFDYNESVSAMKFYSEGDMSDIRHWTKTGDVKLVPKDLTDKQLLLFYSACDGDVTKTKKCIERFYYCRKNAPELFDNRIITSEELKSTIEAFEFCVLPGKSCEGYNIIYHNIYDPDYSKFNHALLVKVMIMTIDLCLLKRGSQAGYMFVLDMKGLRFGHILKTRLSVLRKALQYLQEAMPIKLKAVHVLNTDPIFDKILFIAKPFMDKKYLDMITLHRKTEDPVKLFDVIPRTSLPSDYGGFLPNSHTLHKQCMEELRNFEPYFRAEEAQRIEACAE